MARFGYSFNGGDQHGCVGWIAYLDVVIDYDTIFVVDDLSLASTVPLLFQGEVVSRWDPRGRRRIASGSAIL